MTFKATLGLVSGLIVLTPVLGLGGCATPAPPTAAAPPSGHNSRDSIDWAGTYKGTLPCADCEGIETIVRLNADGTYSTSSRYLGRDAPPTTGQGSFTWDDTGGIVRLSGNSPTSFRVGEGRLIQLAQDGSRIEGPLADRYVLAKVQSGILERRWKLVELNGQPVPPVSREAFLVLRADGTANGSGGCNNFTGGYTLDERLLRISFGHLASTMMMCPVGMDVEQAFQQVLSTADNFSLNGNQLSLNRARMAPLARFEAVP